MPPPDTPSSPPVAPPHDPYAVLRNRDYLLYLIGRLVAVLGQQMVVVAVGWELYERTHSAMALGLVGLTQMLPMILGTLPAGHVADNYPRKQIIAVTTGILALASLGLTLISAFQAPVFWIYVCLFVMGMARTFLWPASSSFVPHLVPRHLFSRAVTWNSSTFRLSSVAGPAVGGAIIAATESAVPAYAFNILAALTYLTMILAIRRKHEVAVREPMTLTSLGAGFQFVFASPVLFATITLDLFAVLLGGATALLPLYAKEILEASPRVLGLLQAAMPAGAMMCALFLAHRPPLEKAGRAMLWAVTGFGLATIGFGCSRWFYVSFALLVFCGVLDNISVVVRHTLVQLLTPDDKRGRVTAVNSLFIGTSNELGGFRAGTVAHWFGPALGNSIAFGAVVSVVSGGVGTILAVLAVAWLWPELRRYGRLDV